MHPQEKELIFLILQFLTEMGYRKTLHKLEQESKIFFNWNYFREILINGKWVKGTKYLSAFTKFNDNSYSRAMFLLMQTEALGRNLDTMPAKDSFCEEFQILVGVNPIFRDKLMFPNMKKSRLWVITYNLLALNPDQRTRIKNASVFDTLASLHRELIFIVLQFLDEEKFNGTLHKLEKESKIFFNMNYFEQFLMSGEWDKAEKYLSAFTKLSNNKHSTKIFFEIRKQKYCEALGSQSYIHMLKLPDSYGDFTCSILLYFDASSTRARLCDALKTIVKCNPILRDKLVFPSTDTARFLALIKESLNLGNDNHASLMPNAYMETNLVDFILRQPVISQAPSLDMESSSQGAGVLQVSSGLDTRNITDMASPNFCVGVKSTEKSAKWKLTEIKQPSECHTLVLQDESLAGRVARLIYSHSGDSILGLTHNAKHNLWRWTSDQHWAGKANAIVPPQFDQPSCRNELNAHPDSASPLFALTKNDSHLFSVFGRKMSVLVFKTFKTSEFKLPPSPAATYLAILPLNDNSIALGCEDFSIKIYCYATFEVKAKLKGHQNRITCLAFSDKLNMLVSSGADGQLCAWNANGWEKAASTFLQTPIRLDPAIINHIEFQKDQIQLLAVHERLIAIYMTLTSKLVYRNQLCLQESCHPITHATYSCDGQSVYVSFKDGSVGVHVATTLQRKCLINLTAYTQPDPSLEIYPLVIAAHPSEPNQFALGLTNGRVHVLEPLESEGEWGIPLPPKDSKPHGTPLV